MRRRLDHMSAGGKISAGPRRDPGRDRGGRQRLGPTRRPACRRARRRPAIGRLRPWGPGAGRRLPRVRRSGRPAPTTWTRSGSETCCLPPSPTH